MQPDNQLKIHVDELKNRPRQLSVAEPVAAFPLLEAVQHRGECEFLAPITVNVDACWEYDHVRVHGRVGTRVQLPCARCLKQFEAEIGSAFTIFYTRSVDSARDEEVELAEEDLVAVPYSGETIDLRPELSEQVILEIPFKPLCTDDCRGLCTQCGADLNDLPCQCQDEVTNLRFKALEGFKVNT